jgi:hypothetical protein
VRLLDRLEGWHIEEMTQVTVVMLNTEETHRNYIFGSLLNIPAASQNMDYQMIFKIKNDKLKKDTAGSTHHQNKATIWHLPEIRIVKYEILSWYSCKRPKKVMDISHYLLG